MDIYITCLLQILNFPSRFRRFEMKHFLRRPIMVVESTSWLVAPQNFFHFYGLVKYSQSDLLRFISENMVNIRQHKAPNIPKKKENCTFRIIYEILCVLLEFHVAKIIAYLIERIVLFVYTSSFLIHSIQKTLIFFVFAWCVSCACKLFSVNCFCYQQFS